MNWKLLIPGMCFIIFLFAVTVLNYFVPLPIPLSFLPQKDENQIVLIVNQKKISLKEYKESLKNIQQVLKDPKKSKEKTVSLLISEELLKEELVKQGHPYLESEFIKFLLENNLYQPNIPSGYLLEMRVAYLKNQIPNYSFSWYSGFVFIARLIGPSTSGLSDSQRAPLATEKIKQVRQAITDSKEDPASLDARFSKDTELNKINSNQAYMLTFEKMRMENPTITSPEILNVIKNLKKGQVSEVFEATDPGLASKQPFALVVVKLTDTNPGYGDTINNWLNQAKAKSKIEVKI